MKSEKIECSSWTFGSVGIQVGPDLFDMCNIPLCVCDLGPGPCMSKLDFMQHNSGYFH
jgi:hypothetical protein